MILVNMDLDILYNDTPDDYEFDWQYWNNK
jgi:hypothetical protein